MRSSPLSMEKFRLWRCWCICVYFYLFVHFSVHYKNFLFLCSLNTYIASKLKNLKSPLKGNTTDKVIHFKINKFFQRHAVRSWTATSHNTTHHCSVPLRANFWLEFFTESTKTLTLSFHRHWNHFHAHKRKHKHRCTCIMLNECMHVFYSIIIIKWNSQAYALPWAPTAHVSYLIIGFVNLLWNNYNKLQFIYKNPNGYLCQCNDRNQCDFPFVRGF